MAKNDDIRNSSHPETGTGPTPVVHLPPGTAPGFLGAKGLSEAEYWRSMARESQLRIANMKTMHRLRFRSARAKWKSAEHNSVTDDFMERNELDKLYILDNSVDPVRMLPDDLLFLIFSYLPFHDLISAQRVSRRWQAYLTTESRLYRSVSFLNSKHQIPLTTIQKVISSANSRIISLEFNLATLVHMTPLVPIYPYLERLEIMHSGKYLSHIFQIALQHSKVGGYHNLPSLRIAIFHESMLLNNELVTLLCIAANLENFECQAVRVSADKLDDLRDSHLKVKRLCIHRYSQDRHSPPLSPSEHRKSPAAILYHLPDLEELTLGLEWQVLDLTNNRKIRYLDCLHGQISSFIQPPPSLQVCLNATRIHRFLPDNRPYKVPAENYPLLFWEDPPSFVHLTLAHSEDFYIIQRVLRNSWHSLVELRLAVTDSRAERDFSYPPHTDRIYHPSAYDPTLTFEEMMSPLQSLRILGIDFWADFSRRNLEFLKLRLPVLSSLERLSISFAWMERAMTSEDLVQFVRGMSGRLNELELLGHVKLEDRILQVAESNGVKIIQGPPRRKVK